MSVVPEGGNEEESDERSIDGRKSEQQLAKKSENSSINGKKTLSRRWDGTGAVEKVQESRKSMAILVKL